MRKKLLKFASLFLCIVLFAGMAACKKGGKSSTSDSEQTSGGDTPAPPVTAEKETEYDLVKDSESEYKVVLSPDVLLEESFAADEIVNFFKESTGFTLPIVAPADVTLNKNSKLIILSNAQNEAAPFKESEPFDKKEKLTQQFYHVKTSDSNVFIKGGDHLGVLFGAYDFLHHQLNYEFYEQNCIAVDKGVTNRKLYDLDLTDGPDILWRHPHYGPVYEFRNGNRYKMTRNPWLTERGHYVHNTFSEFFPKGTYEQDHKEYYSYRGDKYDGRQLCYSGHGDPNILKEMQDIVFERIKSIVTKEYGKGHYVESVSFTHQDVNSWCSCPACRASKQKYHTDSAVLIKFINPVAKRVRKWMKENYPGHNVNIAIFAYQVTEAAPVELDPETGEYRPVDNDKSLYLEPNVALFYAPFYMDYNHDFDDECNKTYRDTLLKWRVLAKQLYLWTYSLCTHDYMSIYDTFNSMQPIYRKAKEMNTVLLFDQGRYDAYVLTGFDTLKMYLNAKLAWNVDEDYEQLIQNFFDNYFEEGSEAMKRYFDHFRMWMMYRRDHCGAPGVLNRPPRKEDFPKRVLETWNECIEEAYKAIEPIKKRDAEQYQLVYDRICKESMAVRYHLITFHGDTYPLQVLRDMKREFKRDAGRYGFTLIQEATPLDPMIKDW